MHLMAKLGDRKKPSAGGCRFCTVGTDLRNVAFSDRPLVSTPEYSVIASLGSLVAGWTLVVPRDHVLNLATKYHEHEFTRLRTSLVARIEDEFSCSVRIFEHGAVKTGSQTGCGVDHGHLHVVPYPRSLEPHLLASGTWIRAATSEIRRIAGDREYLFYSDAAISDDPKGVLHLVDVPVSQFFRRILATDLGIPEAFDYRTHSFDANIRVTHQRLLQDFETEPLSQAV
jgi:ATP adenylyltransferase